MRHCARKTLPWADVDKYRLPQTMIKGSSTHSTEDDWVGWLMLLIHSARNILTLAGADGCRWHLSEPDSRTLSDGLINTVFYKTDLSHWLTVVLTPNEMGDRLLLAAFRMPTQARLK